MPGEIVAGAVLPGGEPLALPMKSSNKLDPPILVQTVQLQTDRIRAGTLQPVNKFRHFAIRY